MKHLLGLLFLSLFFSSCTSYKATPLEATEFRQMILDNSDVQLVDVRKFNEFITGHIPDAYNIDFYKEGFKDGLDTLDRTKPIAVYCLVGQRSAEAYQMLVDMKFQEVYHLTGGTVAWRREAFEINEGRGRYEPSR